MKSTTILSAAALLFGLTQAHITMQSPLPYNELFDTAPLNPTGSDFPCKKGDSGYTAKGTTNATVGQPVQISFHGSADHNGGSCQFVLSKDDFASLAPTSQFKVIYSVMGGCPGISGVENTYSVPIPSEVPSGSYTMGWTWFNKVGNREMYMNCASMDISGGQGTDADFSSLPDMAVYNIKSVNDCGTSETGDVQFPNPGKYVLTGPGFTPKPPTGSCATGGSDSALAPGTSTGGGSVAPGDSPASGNSGAGSTGGFDDGQYHPNGSGTGKATASVKVPAATSAVATTLMTIATPTVEAPTPAVATSAASSPPTPANGTSEPTGGYIGETPPPAVASPSGSSPIPPPATGAGQACSTDGAVVCSPDGTQFGICNHGKVQFMAVAAGTKCIDGKVIGRRARKVRSSV
ncbi:gb [Venturia nashicola]|uniref:Gb n=1 Tax=Venturia nashicola TaxID=86259 RepID=A0A4Z1PFJ4_9PEZI|nr:gb [Venturia nashicola]